MLNKVRSQFDIRFSDTTLEQKYEVSKRNHQRLLLNIILVYGFLIGILGWIMNPFNLPVNEYLDWKRILSLLAIVSMALIMLLISYKRSTLNRVLLLIMILFIFFGFIETFHYKKKDGDPNFYQIVGMSKEFMTISVMLAKYSWKISFFLLCLFNMCCAFRYTDFRSNFDMSFYPLIHYTLNTLLLSASLYFLEIYDRECFCKIKHYEDSLSCFKELITNSFPNAVILIKGERIFFNNQKTLDIFECDENEQIMERLDNMILEEASKSSVNQFQKENLKSEDYQPMIKEKFNETSFRMPQILRYDFKNPKIFWGVLNIAGKKKSLEINLTKIMWENDLVIMIIISENEIMEKMKVVNENSEYKDRLLATVSHDLRTPLNGIMGMIRMTIDINEEKQTRKYLNIALRSSQLLLLMINDILDFSQISNGKLRLNYETFCLWNLIKDVSKLFKFQTKMKGLDFKKENIAADLKINTLIKSDPNRIKQVLFNLLGNALKFTTQGSITIRLKPWMSEINSCPSYDLIAETKRGFVISVQDTGIGIKKEDQSCLFKLFGKIHNENTANMNKSGVGLGLAISQSLIRILNNNKKNGEITVHSEYEKGSCFSFVLFLEDEEEINEDQIFLKSIKEVSENEILKKSIPLKRALGEYEYDNAFNGEQAIQIIKKMSEKSHFYDIILMDCNMPKMNGAEAALIIDKMIGNKEIPSLYMIACTANASAKDYDFNFKNGKFDHITKPFSKLELKDKLEK